MRTLLVEPSFELPILRTTHPEVPFDIQVDVLVPTVNDVLSASDLLVAVLAVHGKAQQQGRPYNKA